MKQFLPGEWALHIKAHRIHIALACAIVLVGCAALFSRIDLPLNGFIGAQPTPAVCLIAVLIAAVAVRALEPRTSIETTAVRPLDRIIIIATWLFAGLAGTTLLIVGDHGLFLRALLAALGMSLLTWRISHHALSALPAVCWFVFSTAFARLLPGTNYWGFFTVEGTPVTWILPIFLAAISMLARR